MKARRNLVLLVIYALVLLAPAPWMPLRESTEARYAEIAREMVCSGDWCTPTLEGIKHFHKPPLAYWATAAGLKLCGMNELGARLGVIAAAILALIFGHRLATLLLAERHEQENATCILASSLLFLALARTPATDMFLAAFTFMAQYALFSRVTGRRVPTDAYLCGLALGLGFLTKGPIILLFTLLPILVCRPFGPTHRRLFAPRERLVILLICSICALPWFAAVIHRNPGLLDYFITVQTVGRAASDRFDRTQPWWFFLAAFALAILPFTVFFLRGLGNPGRLQRPMLLAHLAAPLVIFTLARSKQATYILPCMALTAVITAECFSRFDSRPLRNLTFGILAVLCLGLFLAAPGYDRLEGHQPLVLSLTLIATLLLVPVWRLRHSPGFVRATAAWLITLVTLVCLAFPLLGPDIRGYARLTRSINRADPARTQEVLVFRDFLPSVSFYRGRISVTALGKARETQFETDEAWQRHCLTTEDELRAWLGTHPEGFVIMKHGREEEFVRLSNARISEIYRQRSRSAWQWSIPGPNP